MISDVDFHEFEIESNHENVTHKYYQISIYGILYFIYRNTRVKMFHFIGEKLNKVCSSDYDYDVGLW